ncbi:MAG: type II toxin-antitoxin system VapC family toxin [Acidobacteriota bacterium]|jgi:tRNA(fMet)-specific endonuclease VapC
MSSGADASIGRLVLDTSAYSWMRSGHDTVLDLVAAAEIVIVPVTVLGELEGGFELGTRQRENRTTLQEFLSEPFVTVRPTSPGIARRYGEIFAQLRRAGTPIPVNDLWIAATTLDCGGHLLTFDDHFRSVPGLSLTVLEQP